MDDIDERLGVSAEQHEVQESPSLRAPTPLTYSFPLSFLAGSWAIGLWDVFLVSSTFITFMWSGIWSWDRIIRYALVSRRATRIRDKIQNLTSERDVTTSGLVPVPSPPFCIPSSFLAVLSLAFSEDVVPGDNRGLGVYPVQSCETLSRLASRDEWWAFLP